MSNNTKNEVIQNIVLSELSLVNSGTSEYIFFRIRKNHPTFKITTYELAGNIATLSRLGKINSVDYTKNKQSQRVKIWSLS